MASQAQLAQYAINIAIAMQAQLQNGQAEPASRGNLTALCGAVVALSQAVLNNSGGTIPGSLLTGKYSVAQSPTAPIVT